MDVLDYWKLCDELNIIQAALLIIGEDPSGEFAYVENWQVHERPQGYEAGKTALTNALKQKTVDGTLISEYEYDINGNCIGIIDGSIDIEKSTISVDSIRKWLLQRGFRTGFFFPESNDSPDYLDHNHPCYAPKLAAAINAWQAVTTDPKYVNNGKHVKQNLESWLTSHAAKFDLVKDDGEINSDAIKNQISKVANWKDKGGAPKTPSS
jgi:hypothetical protein